MSAAENTVVEIKAGKFERSISSDPSASFWLKEQLEATKNRDLVDALNDAEALAAALKERLAMNLNGWHR